MWAKGDPVEISEGSAALSRLLPWIDRGLDLLFPSRCAGCGRPGAVWCPACDAALVPLVGRLCPKCGLPLDAPKTVCRSCRISEPALPIRSHARYRGPVIRAILQLKYRPNKRLATTMGGWLAAIARRESWRPRVIAPVPLGPKRLRQRGYNQATLIAAGLAESLGARLQEGLLVRTRETRSQVGLKMGDRRRNVQGAFQAFPSELQGQSVCIVDDLCTTGATLSACAEALLAAGAAEVVGLTVARA